MKGEVIMFEEISENTMMIEPVKDLVYKSKIINIEGEKLSEKSPMKLIREGCLEGGSTYQGRKEAMKQLLNISQRVPIPIIPERGIYAFPTHSPDNWNNNWIFFFHIKKVVPESINKAKIIFKNGEQITLDISYHSITKQRQRTSECVVKLSQVKHVDRNCIYI
jgi:competence protein ComK